MSIDWDDYEPYDPGVSDPPRTLPRSEARRVFKHCMETKPPRVAMLSRLLKANGVELTSADTSIQDLNEWFFASVEADPEQPGRLLPIWYSVCHDVALFLGDVMIERHPNLRWEFFTWARAAGSSSPGQEQRRLPTARDHGFQLRGSEVPHQHRR